MAEVGRFSLGSVAPQQLYPPATSAAVPCSSFLALAYISLCLVPVRLCAHVCMVYCELEGFLDIHTATLNNNYSNIMALLASIITEVLQK